MTHRDDRALRRFHSVLLAVAGLLLAGAAVGANVEQWITVAEDGWWTFEDGRQVDLSDGLKVIQHRETGLQRVVPNAYGTGDPTNTVIPAHAFLPAYDQAGGPLNVEYAIDLSGWVYKTGGSNNFAGDFLGPVSLPTGARLQSVVLEACDDHSPGSILVLLQKCAFASNICQTLTSVSTGNNQTPGCMSFVASIPGETIANLSWRYYLQVVDSHNGPETRFRSVELWWKRQVSPAPAFPTFDDVPTGHPFFQHIEALVDSGITSGCDANSYCPNAPLTRGQMAVFLAKALGLHWPH